MFCFPINFCVVLQCDMFCFPIKFCSCVDSGMFCFPIKFCSRIDSVACFVFLLNFVALLTVWHVLFSY